MGHGWGMQHFKPTHNLKVPGSSHILVEAVVQDGTEPWFKLFIQQDEDEPLFVWGTDGKVRRTHTRDVVEGATVERI